MTCQLCYCQRWCVALLATCHRTRPALFRIRCFVFVFVFSFKFVCKRNVAQLPMAHAPNTGAATGAICAVLGHHINHYRRRNCQKLHHREWCCRQRHHHHHRVAARTERTLRTLTTCGMAEFSSSGSRCVADGTHHSRPNHRSERTSAACSSQLSQPAASSQQQLQSRPCYQQLSCEKVLAVRFNSVVLATCHVTLVENVTLRKDSAKKNYSKSKLR